METLVKLTSQGLLSAYAGLPHHPGKGMLMKHLLPSMGRDCGVFQRTRFGIHFECDLMDQVSREIYYSAFDMPDCRAMHKLIRSGSVVFDAGANIGYFSLLFANWVGSRGIVHAFEPFPDTVRRFKRNLALNPPLSARIKLHEIALSNSEGTVSMSVPDPNNAGANYIGNGDGRIPMGTLDCFLERAGISRIDLIKIDIEGSEIAMLEGASSTIAKFRPILVIEVNQSTLQRFGKTSADLISTLRDYRYHLYSASGLGNLRPLRQAPIGGEVNVYALP